MDHTRALLAKVSKHAAEVPLEESPPEHIWPDVSTPTYLAIVLTPIAFTILFIIILALWPVTPLNNHKKRDGQSADEETPLMEQTGKKEKKSIMLEAGEVAGDYSENWTRTFDMVFLVSMMLALVALIVCTWVMKPELFTNWLFWKMQLPKLFVMIGISVVMGIICRRFCKVDADGYIITNKGSWFKVNYTRKVQHLAAYIIPLVFVTSAECNCDGTLETAWGQWVTLLAFLCMIKPVRERSTLFMLQFNSMDRPEDRPYTMKWIIAGNIVWGELLILFWRRIYAPIGHVDLAFIFIYITGLGDGFAEPVGIWLGRHKYSTSSCSDSRKYTRSYEGSACVFLSAMIFTSVYYYSFANATQFWVCFFVLGPIMAVAEATAPHTMDTPVLMFLGGLVIYLTLRFL